MCRRVRFIRVHFIKVRALDSGQQGLILTKKSGVDDGKAKKAMIIVVRCQMAIRRRWSAGWSEGRDPRDFFGSWRRGRGRLHHDERALELKLT